MISANVGVAAPLELQLYDGAIDKGVRAAVYSQAGSLLDVIDLTHLVKGLYTGSWTPPAIGYYEAVFTVYTDGTHTTEDLFYARATEVYYAISSVGINPADVAHAVWDAALTDYHLAGSFGVAIAAMLANTDPSAIGANVWDALTASHTAAGSFGLMLQVMKQTTDVLQSELESPVTGLSAIKTLIQTQTNTIIADIAAVSLNVDELEPLIIGVEASISAKVLDNKTLLTDMAIQNEADTTAIINEILIAEAKIDAVNANVDTLQNNTTARFVVPEALVKPSTGTKDYQFHLRIYDNNGSPKAPDSAPTIRVRRLDTGVDLVLNAPMTQDGVKVGAYYYVYTISAGTALYPLLVEVTIVEDGIARYIPSVTETTEFQSDLQSIQSAIATVDSKVTNTQSQITNPTYGLAALKSGEIDILAAISAESVILGQIKAKTDLIRSDMATTGDISGLSTQISALPSLLQISTLVDISTQTIMGSGGWDLTDIYNLWDVSSLLQSNDPRLNYLDAAISSRSTLTVNEVWNYPTRTITSYGLDSVSIKAIWDYLCSAANVPGSIGKRIADYLDVAVSSRARSSDVMSALAGVAQESTLLATRSDILNSLVECKNLVNTVITKTTAIQAKTDRIPTNPASETTLEEGIGDIRFDINNLKSTADQIKVSTDRLPVDPARETSVGQIPRNPLLTTDARLTNLDARISTRSILSSSDLAPLATKTDVTSAKNTIIGEINENQDLIEALTLIAQRTDSNVTSIKFSHATMTALMAVEESILAAIDQISIDDALTAQEVWSYPTRDLTTDPKSFGPDISNLATKQDVAAVSSYPQYVNRMTTAFNPATSLQEVLVWSEKDGQQILAVSDCVVTVKDSQGTILWAQSSSLANADGIFRFVNPIVVSADANYYIIMSVKVSGVSRVTQQAFITVG